MSRQLYKSKSNRVLAGVCGGFAEYFGIDVTLIRIIWIIVTLFGGAGLIAYIIAAIIMPEENEYTNQGSTWNSTTSDSSWTKDTGSADTGYSPYSEDGSKTGDDWGKAPAYHSDKNRIVIGAALVIIGIALVIKLIFPGFDAKYLIPILLIGIGGLVIYKGRH